MTFQGCVGRRQSDPCIPVILVSIDLPVHTFTQVNILFMKKKIEFFKLLNILHTVYLMAYLLSLWQLFINKINFVYKLLLETLKTGLNVSNAMVIDKLITN